MSNIKIVITVSGGVVTAVYSSNESVEVELLDFDNLEDRATDADLEAKTKNLKKIF